MRLPPERPGVPPASDLTAWRSGLDAAIASGQFNVEPAHDATSLAGVDALVFRPPGISQATVLHFHGGGFRVGRPEQVAPFAAALAHRAGVTVICPRYRLAPEHPFPAALNDARAALTALQGSGERQIVLSGDSAGGGIATGLTAISADDALCPRGLVLLSPWLDLTLGNATLDSNAGSDPLFSRNAAEAAANLYLQDIPADHPLASPGLGPVDRFPPTFLSVGDGEVLLGDSVWFHDALVEAGVPVRMQILPGMEHVAVTRGLQLPGATETMAALCAFVADILMPDQASGGRNLPG